MTFGGFAGRGWIESEPIHNDGHASTMRGGVTGSGSIGGETNGPGQMESFGPGGAGVEEERPPAQLGRCVDDGIARRRPNRCCESYLMPQASFSGAPPSVGCEGLVLCFASNRIPVDSGGSRRRDMLWKLALTVTDQLANVWREKEWIHA